MESLVLLITYCSYQAEKAKVIQTLLFVAGLNTLLQAWFGTRLPVVIGGSFRYIIPAVFIALANRYNQFGDPRQVSSDLQCSLSFFNIDLVSCINIVVFVMIFSIEVSQINERNSRGCHDFIHTSNFVWFSGNMENCCEVYFPNSFEILLFCLELSNELNSLVSCCRFLSPLSAVPLVTLVGLGLYQHGFPMV